MTATFRLCSRRFSPDRGTGAALNGARWNSPGVEVIYTAATLSLAALEILVHLSVLPDDYVATEIHIPDRIGIEHVPDNQLPPHWDAIIPTRASQTFGDVWAGTRRSAVLTVPSSIIPSERNLLLNPAHPDFAAIQFLAPHAFSFDRRLK